MANHALRLLKEIKGNLPEIQKLQDNIQKARFHFKNNPRFLEKHPSIKKKMNYYIKKEEPQLIRDVRKVISALGYAILVMDEHEKKVNEKIFALCDEISDDIDKKERAISSFINKVSNIDRFNFGNFKGLVGSWKLLIKNLGLVFHKVDRKIHEELEIAGYIKKLEQNDTRTIRMFFLRLTDIKPILEKMNLIFGPYMKRNIATMFYLEGKDVATTLGFKGNYDKIEILNFGARIKEFKKIIKEEHDEFNRIFPRFRFYIYQKYEEVTEYLENYQGGLTPHIISQLQKQLFDTDWGKEFNKFKKGIAIDIPHLFEKERKKLYEIRDSENARADLIRRMANTMVNVTKFKEKDLQRNIIAEFHTPPLDFQRIIITSHFIKEIRESHPDFFLDENNNELNEVSVRFKLAKRKKDILKLKEEPITIEIKEDIEEEEARIRTHSSYDTDRFLWRNIAYRHFLEYTSEGLPLVTINNEWSLLDGINLYKILTSKKNEFFFKDYVKGKTKIIPVRDIQVNYMDLALCIQERDKRKLYNILKKSAA